MLNPSLTKPEVAALIDETWEQVKRPGIVIFVVDTSGSMLGGKLQQAKDGMSGALDAIAQSNQIGLITFSNTVNTTIDVAPWFDNRFAIAEAVQEIRASGETALYDAIKAGAEMIDAAEGRQDAIRGVVILTDGLANRCQTRLDDLVEMEANEMQIMAFSGCEGDQAAVEVDKEEMIGARIVLDTLQHDIQIFYIGIGDDADLDVGRMLAEATGADFRWGVAEEDLANVLAEFAKYF